MKTYAHLDGLATDASRPVRELIPLDAALVPGKDVFTPDFAAGMVDITSITPAPQVGWITADGGKTFAAPTQAPPSAADLTAYAAQARYAKETTGITVGTASIATDRDSQAMITGMWAAAQINPQIQVSFKSGSGFVTIGAAQVAKIASAVATYVQSCFTAEAQVVAGIASGSVKAPADVDKVLAAVVSTFPSTAAGASAATGTAGGGGSSASSGATS